MIDSSVSRRPVTFSQQLQVQEADHSQEIEKTEEEGRKAACGFGEIGGNCDFTSPRKRPGIQSLIFSEINGVAGFLLLSPWADARGSRAIRRKNCQNLYVTFPETYAVFLFPGEKS